MRYTEKKCNIFKLSGEYHLIHFCRDDGMMNNGFEKYFEIWTKLNENSKLLKPGDLIYNEPVFSLIYSRNSDLVTDVKKQLQEIKSICSEKNIKKLAILKNDFIVLKNGIEYFFDAFEDTNIEILMCL